MAARRASQFATVGLGLAVCAAVGASALFARADQAARVAADAGRLTNLEGAATAAATLRARLVITFAAMTGPDVPAVSLQNAERAVADAAALSLFLTPLSEAGYLRSLADEVEVETIQVRDLLAAGAVDDAGRRVADEIVPRLEGLASGLGTEAAVVAGRIEGEQASAGRMARGASFVVALVVPALVIAFIRRHTRRRMEQQRLEGELARQRELSEAKDQLIAGMSHHLRTPITAIYGWADLLVSNPDPDLVNEASGVILAEAGDLQRMTDDILVTARLEAGQLAFRPKITDMVPVLEGALSHYRQLGVSIKLDCDPGQAFSDAGRLAHALNNLIANALQHGGEPVEVVGRSQADCYRIAVCDRGPDLETDRAEDLFAPAVHGPADLTTRRSLGLGLSVVRSLIVGMGGQVEYGRNDGVTTFVITLPITTAGTA
ncbi:MAG: sensor histidine kinase [Actinomycetota bacterium]